MADVTTPEDYVKEQCNKNIGKILEHIEKIKEELELLDVDDIPDDVTLVNIAESFKVYADNLAMLYLTAMIASTWTRKRLGIERNK